MGKWKRKPSYWKTYDYKSGHTYILGEKFAGKMQAMAYAKSCGMVVISESTCSITDIERENLILKERLKALKGVKVED